MCSFSVVVIVIVTIDDDAVVNNFGKAFINSCKSREYHSPESQLLN